MKTYIIGVGGGSGSGKSTAVQNITQVLKSSQYVILPQDAYYKDQHDLSMEQRAKINYDHPESIETQLLVQHIQKLKEGYDIERPVYDYSIHQRSNTVIKISPAPIILVEGILIYENEELRDLFDLKLFIDTPSDIRFIRRLQRDMAERGRDMQSVIDQYLETVRPMYDEFIEPSRRYADVIIPEGGRNWQALDLVLNQIRRMVN